MVEPENHPIGFIVKIGKLAVDELDEFVDIAQLVIDNE
jgi:hypothetical protein